MKNFFKKSHSNKGFSLVELIVVIAIMAIIAGVSIPIYNVYIDKSEKGNDVSLVGDVIKAIEIGVNSAQFVPSNSVQISATTYPVGFVLLTNEGIKVLTSGTQVIKDDRACEFIVVENSYSVSKVRQTFYCDGLMGACSGSVSGDVFTISGPSTVKYCKTHSQNVNVETVSNKQYDTTIGISGSGFLVHNNHSPKTQKTDPITGNIVEGTLYFPNSNNENKCDFAYNGSTSFDSDHIVNGANGVAMDTTHPIYQAISAAYGDISQIKLSYDKWSSEEGLEFATFYAGAPMVMDRMETLTGLLALAGGTSLGANTLGLSTTYSSSEDVLSKVCDNMMNTFQTEEAWLQRWNVAGNKTWDSYGFDLTGRENYSAARMAYNVGFASYLEAKKYDSTYIDIIKNFNSQELLGVGLPGLVCTDAFTDSESPLKSKFNNDTKFAEVAALFEEYKNSKACEENGRVFYQTMKTFKDTERFANESGDMFGYYNSYVDEIAGLYKAAQDVAGEGIIIAVSVENGKVIYDVFPSTADPREK